MLIKATYLPEWIEKLQSSGCYTFTREQALHVLKHRQVALRHSLYRLIQKKRIVLVRRGFYVIVPPEYKSSGAPPVSWFLDEFMKYQKQPYYVGLLSAAEIHGSAHERPQVFQVMTDFPIRPIQVGRSRIHFYKKQKISNTPITVVQTETGMMNVSTPEATVLDLIRYEKRVGGLGEVLTVLRELAEKINVSELIKRASLEKDLTILQRLGYLFDFIKAHVLSKALHQYFLKKQATWVPLRPEQNSKAPKKNLRWKVLVNEELEKDA